MSRSNPTGTTVPNPATRYFSWGGEDGTLSYYDKAQNTRIKLKLPFQFLLLDEVSSVSGYHEPTNSHIYSNQVRNVGKDPLVVRTAGRVLARGLYKEIKDTIASFGARFTTNCYIAYPDGDDLRIGSLGLRGAALKAWMAFKAEARRDLYSKAIEITGYTEGKKGRVTYRMPTFELVVADPEQHELAVALDRQVQEYLTAVMTRKPTADAEPVAPESDDVAPEADRPADLYEEDIPF